MTSHGVSWPKSVNRLSEQEQVKELKEIREYQNLEKLIRAKVAKHEYTIETLELTTKLLKKNPEYYTFWNIRRRLLIYGLFPQNSASLEDNSMSDHSITTNTPKNPSPTMSSDLAQKGFLSKHEKGCEVYNLIISDLEFLFSVMIKYPKCYWLWNYRLWLLQQASDRLESTTSREIWTHELVLVKSMLARDPRNFHGWSYRKMVVVQLESLTGKSLVESEFAYTTKIIHSPNGLSNFSAWHRRSKLIPVLLKEREADTTTRRKFLDDEFDLVISAMYTDSYPYQQSAWFYYQFLMSSVIEPGEQPILIDSTTENRCERVKEQIHILKDMLDGAEDCKWIYSALIEYTKAICNLEDRDLAFEETKNCQLWLEELRKLDPIRKGRWNDLEKSLKLK